LEGWGRTEFNVNFARTEFFSVKAGNVYSCTASRQAQVTLRVFLPNTGVSGKLESGGYPQTVVTSGGNIYVEAHEKMHENLWRRYIGYLESVDAYYRAAATIVRAGTEQGCIDGLKKKYIDRLDKAAADWNNYFYSWAKSDNDLWEKMNPPNQKLDWPTLPNGSTALRIILIGGLQEKSPDPKNPWKITFLNAGTVFNPAKSVPKTHP
jgi:hypothetical protein